MNEPVSYDNIVEPDMIIEPFANVPPEKYLASLYQRAPVAASPIREYLLTLAFSDTIFEIPPKTLPEWNGIEPERDITLGDKFFNRFYFTTISLSTIGYGDISPKSNKLRGLTIVFAIIIIIEFITFVFETKWNTKK